MKVLSLLFFAQIINCISCFSRDHDDLKISFVNFVDGEKLLLDSGRYKNEFGQEYSVSKFRYYVGQFELTDLNGKISFADEYHLIDEDKPSSLQFALKNIPAWNYKSISFIIGVDSARNCTGLQEGDLDPLKGMFWAWNTGYIFLKLEGHSTASHSTGEIFEYHIGGYKAPANAIRKVKIEITDHRIRDENLPMHEIIIKSNVAQILKQPVKIDFSILSSVVDQKNAEMMADNYSDMFTIEMVK